PRPRTRSPHEGTRCRRERRRGIRPGAHQQEPPVSLADHVTADPSESPNRPGRAPALTVDASPDGGEFTGMVTDRPIPPSQYEGAFAKVYELAGLDPADYRIVDDTVRFSAW